MTMWVVSQSLRMFAVYLRLQSLQAAEQGVSPKQIKCSALDPVSDGTSNVSGALIKHVTVYQVCQSAIVCSYLRYLRWAQAPRAPMLAAASSQSLIETG